MTLEQVMDSLGVPAGAKVLAGPMLWMKGMSLDDQVGLQIDRDRERLRLTLKGATIIDATFAQIEAAVRDDGPGPQVDCGNPPDGLSLARA